MSHTYVASIGDNPRKVERFLPTQSGEQPDTDAIRHPGTGPWRFGSLHDCGEVEDR